MALPQELKIYAEELNLDAVRQIYQRDDIKPEQFRDGLLRLETCDAQLFNQLNFLLTLYSAAHPCSPCLIPTTEALPSIALEMDGVTTVNSTDNPNLFEVWGSPLPNLSSSAPAGTRYIVRNS